MNCTLAMRCLESRTLRYQMGHEKALRRQQRLPLWPRGYKPFVKLPAEGCKAEVWMPVPSSSKELRSAKIR